MTSDLDGEYFFNGSELKEIPRRLAALEEGYDPGTVSRLENLGVGRGWSCLEVGAGAGPITRWLGRRVGSGGEVVATDLDTSFLDVSDADNVEIRQLDLRSDSLPETGSIWSTLVSYSVTFPSVRKFSTSWSAHCGRVAGCYWKNWIPSPGEPSPADCTGRSYSPA